MRIISGNLGRAKLYLTKDKTIRPLKDIVRESIFNLLTHSNKIGFELEECNVLDLYSGTGSFGLECLSRRAKSIYFVESNKIAIKILKKNIEKLKLKKKTQIFFSDVCDVIEKHNILDKKFDLIFCDPPFKHSNIEKLIKLIFNKNILNKNGIVILHRKKNTLEKLPKCLKILDERIYGISKITFGRFLS